LNIKLLQFGIFHEKLSIDDSMVDNTEQKRSFVANRSGLGIRYESFVRRTVTHIRQQSITVKVTDQNQEGLAIKSYLVLLTTCQSIHSKSCISTTFVLLIR